MTRLNESRILITGAAGGIGKVLCQHLAGLGATILAVDHHAENLESLDQLDDQNIQTLNLNCCDAASVEKHLANQAITHLINNAGGGRSLRLADCSVEDWNQDIQLNLNSAFYVTRAVLPSMIRRHDGVVINIGSVNGAMALGHPAYSAAKAGLAHFTKSLALEYGRKGIRANCIALGTVATPCWQARREKNPQVIEEVSRWYPAGRVVTPLDVAYLVAFLLSDQARMITGAVMPLDGGLSAGNGYLAADLTQTDFWDDGP